MSFFVKTGTFLRFSKHQPPLFQEKPQDHHVATDDDGGGTQGYSAMHKDAVYRNDKMYGYAALTSYHNNDTHILVFHNGISASYRFKRTHTLSIHPPISSTERL
jgi:hypothetical protein